MRTIFRGAVVLLVAIAMVFSTVAIADTQVEKPAELYTINEGSGYGAIGDVVWDNGMNYDGLLAAQEPSSPENLDAYPADDFHFEEDTFVCDVHWIGGYYNGDPEEWDWCILFYKDRGDGEAPGDRFAGEFCYAWDEINKEELEPGYWEMWVDLPENILFEACVKYWISIWAVGDHFPQSGWGYHADPVTMHEAVLKSDWFGVPDWTPLSQLIGTEADMAFQLTTKEPCDPCIDVEKYVLDLNGEWVDADTEDEAVDLPICTDAKFKIVIHNCGDVDLIDIKVADKMHDSLKYRSADPEPGEYYYEPPFHYMNWYFPGPLKPCETIEIIITAHVEGPDCSIDFNYVLVSALGCGNEVRDDDYAYVHAYKTGRNINTPLMNLLELLANQFPIIKVLFGI